MKKKDLILELMAASTAYADELVSKKPAATKATESYPKQLQLKRPAVT